jgi:hypothetical protein
MRRIHWKRATVLAAAGGLLASGVAAQTGFNGVITFTSHQSDGKPTTFVQTTKGRKVRIDGFGGSQGAMIIDGDAKVVMMVEPEKKQYFTMTEEDMKQVQAMTAPMLAKAKEMKSHHTDPGKYRFENTGRTETVAGVRCEVWHGTYAEEDSTEEGEACMASGVGFALAELTFANPMMQPGQSGWEGFEQFRQLTGGNKGLLKVTKLKDGKATTDLEATKIQRTVVSDDAFKPPVGYTEVKMGEMMLQAQNAMKQMQEKMKEKDKEQGQR